MTLLSASSVAVFGQNHQGAFASEIMSVILLNLPIWTEFQYCDHIHQETYS